MKTKHVVVILTVLASFFIIPQILHAQTQITAEQLEKIRGRKVTAAEVREANELMRKWTEYYKVADKRRFHIKGEVVDEQGIRLTGVTMHVGKSISGGFMQENRYTGKQYVVNGTFEVRESGCESVSIDFEKGGYYRQSIEFFGDAKANTREVQDKIMKGLPVEEPMVGKEGLRIVMEKVGETTHLAEYRGSLKNSVSGPPTIVDLTRNKEYISVSIEGTNEEGPFPDNTISMSVEKDETGRFSLVKRSTKPGYPEINVPRRVTVTINLKNKDLSKGETGFIKYAAKPANTLRSMKQAPERGYGDLVIEADEFIKMRDPEGGDSQYCYFFFKINGKYGKGRIASFSLNKEEEILGIRLNLWLQRNNSRNLESAYEL